MYSNSHDDGLLTNRLYDMDESTLAEPERDTVQPVQTATMPSLNYDTAVNDQRAENERYSEVAFNTNKGEVSDAADVYASIDT